ncbi:MAG: hypothetical protein ACKOB0_08535, partial [Chthoniobacterales bacterium]
TVETNGHARRNFVWKALAPTEPRYNYGKAAGTALVCAVAGTPLVSTTGPEAAGPMSTTGVA